MSQPDIVSDEPASRFDWTDAESTSHAVIEDVTDVADADPLYVEPLHSAVDTDALNSIFRPADDASHQINASVRFDYLGYRVVLDSDGQGALYELADASTSAADTSRQATPTDD